MLPHAGPDGLAANESMTEATRGPRVLISVHAAAQAEPLQVTAARAPAQRISCKSGRLRVAELRWQRNNARDLSRYAFHVVRNVRIAAPIHPTVVCDVFSALVTGKFAFIGVSIFDMSRQTGPINI